MQVRTTDMFGLVEEELQKHVSGRKSSFRSGKDRTDLNISGMTVPGRNLEKQWPGDAAPVYQRMDPKGRAVF